MANIIGLTGHSLCGKDTVGTHLINKYGYTRVSFAAKIKEAVAALFDLPASKMGEYKLDTAFQVEVVQVGVTIKSFTFRHMHQRMGTQVGRWLFGDDFWVDQALPKDYKTPELYMGTVITDVKFQNEVDRIHELGGHVIRIKRPQTDKLAGSHQSEEQQFQADFVINNKDGFAQLYHKVDAIMDNIKDWDGF